MQQMHTIDLQCGQSCMKKSGVLHLGSLGIFDSTCGLIINQIPEPAFRDLPFCLITFFLG